MPPLDTTAESNPPGTVHLVDLSQRGLPSHGLNNPSDVLLIPTPSSDPDDPLNWSTRRKLLATACTSIYTLAIGMANSVVYSILVPISASSNLSSLSCPPFALQYGKRPTYLISTIGVLGMAMWSPYCTTSGQWLAKSIIGGFFAAPVEGLIEASVTDIFFTHQRGTYMGVYALALSSSNAIAPIIFGFVNDGQGWRWCFYWSAIFCGATLLFLFFALEESNYERKYDGRAPPETSGSSISHGQQEKPPPELIASGHPAPITSSEPSLSRRSYLQKLSLVNERRDLSRGYQIMGHRVITSVKLVTWPCVFYSGFSNGATLVWNNVMNTTASAILSSPPYSFQASFVGLFYIAGLVGVILCFLCCSFTSDMLAISLSRRRNGIYEPEYRLWLFSIASVFLPTGLILWGVGASHGIHWFGLAVASMLVGFATTSGILISTTYLVDCYRYLAADGLTSVMLIRNTMSFAIGYGITPWVDGMGVRDCFVTAACVSFVASLLWIPMTWWGKRFRRRSQESYQRLLEGQATLGVVHRAF
ncbi:putative MFS transporter [Aspergillus insuetus]